MNEEYTTAQSDISLPPGTKVPLINPAELEGKTATVTPLPGSLAHRFTYHAPKDGQPAKYSRIRSEAYGLAMTLQGLCPPGRELSLALTKLEEVVMWGNASIARGE